MKVFTKVILKVSTLSTVGFGGWYLGKYTEQNRQLNAENGNSGTCILSNINIKQMPGLPLFGTVSAATSFVPAESETNMGPRLSSTVTRVSEVSKHYLNYI